MPLQDSKGWGAFGSKVGRREARYNLSAMDWGFVGAVAGIVAAAIATIALIPAFGQWLRPRSHRPPKPETDSPPSTGLLVTLALGAVGVPGPNPLMSVVIGASNPNPRPRQVVYVGLQLESKKQIAFTEPGSNRPLPCVLRETEHVTMWASVGEIARTMARHSMPKQQVRACVRDSYDDSHFSKWLDFDPAHFVDSHP